MSANNYIAVQRRSETWFIWEAWADDEDPQPAEPFQVRGTREAALIAAHDRHNASNVIEYGVCELPAKESETK